MNMFGITMGPRWSPTARNRPELDRPDLFPLRQRNRSLDSTESRPRGPIAKAALPEPRAVDSKPLRSRNADIERARRLRAAELSYVAHPSFDDPSARDAILTSSAEFGTAASDRIRVSCDSDADSSRANRIPSREREAHMFRTMNFLKFIVGRIRDRIDPESPVPGDLDEVERLQAEALQLKNEIVETNLRLVTSVAKRRTTACYELCDRISDGTFALMNAVDRFDFARGYRFSTYATWAIFNALKQRDRREWSRRKRSVPLSYGSLATFDVESERYEQNEARAERNKAVERLLCRLDRRERWIMVNRHGIDGVPEQTLKQIGLDLGISKERVRQLEERAHAKLRGFARLEAIEPADF
jgi:RNA polymerase primary sigma factor